MQDTQTDPYTSGRVGVDELFIKFRSSPNFKNMKKYMKYKISNNDTNVSPPNTALDPPPAPNIEQRDKVEAVVHPPLPKGPPPADSPPHDIVLTLKREIEDTDYLTSAGEDSSDMLTQPQELITDFKIDKTKEPSEKQKTICRDFIRGTCTRTGTCKFAHKFDVTQLYDVYTFCRNFQNSVCTLPNCRYVHATVFEEQHFYRTGILPPHALNHHKKVLPPPPPPPQPEDTPPVISTNFTNIPPTHVGVDKPMPVITCVPAASMELRSVDNVLTTALAGSTSPLKRDWNALDNLSNSPRDFEANEQLTKKCKSCEIMEFSLQYEKDEIEKLKRSSEELSKKMGQLTKKSNNLVTVLTILMKSPAVAKASGAANRPASPVNIAGTKEQTIFDQLSNFLDTGSRLSSIDDENKNLLDMNLSNVLLSNLMAKLLQGGPGESTLTLDA